MPLAAAPYRASGLVRWPIATNLTRPDEVRFQGRSRLDLLVANITAWDPYRNSQQSSFDYAISARLNLRRNSNTEILGRFGVDR
jgi:hypothetical protein